MSIRNCCRSPRRSRARKMRTGIDPPISAWWTTGATDNPRRSVSRFPPKDRAVDEVEFVDTNCGLGVHSDAAGVVSHSLWSSVFEANRERDGGADGTPHGPEHHGGTAGSACGWHRRGERFSNRRSDNDLGEQRFRCRDYILSLELAPATPEENLQDVTFFSTSYKNGPTLVKRMSSRSVECCESRRLTWFPCGNRVWQSVTCWQKATTLRLKEAGLNTRRLAM